MAILSDEELQMAKEECCRLGECTATYYLVNLISEVERERATRKAAQGFFRKVCGEVLDTPRCPKCGNLASLVTVNGAQQVLCLMHDCNCG